MNLQDNVGKKSKIIQNYESLKFFGEIKHYLNKQGVITEIINQYGGSNWYRVKFDDGFEGVFSVKKNWIKII